MKPNILLATLFFATAAMGSEKAIVMACETNTRCDGYVANCTSATDSLTVAINPTKQSVSIGGRQIKADFTNPDEVSFPFLNNKVLINRNEYSIIIFNQSEVSFGSCKIVNPAW